MKSSKTPYAYTTNKKPLYSYDYSREKFMCFFQILIIIAFDFMWVLGAIYWSLGLKILMIIFIVLSTYFLLRELYLILYAKIEVYPDKIKSIYPWKILWFKNKKVSIYYEEVLNMKLSNKKILKPYIILNTKNGSREIIPLEASDEIVIKIYSKIKKAWKSYKEDAPLEKTGFQDYSPPGKRV